MKAVVGGGAVRGVEAVVAAAAVAETVAVAVAVAASLQSAVDSPQSADSSRRRRCPTARQAARLAVWQSGCHLVIFLCRSSNNNGSTEALSNGSSSSIWL